MASTKSKPVKRTSIFGRPHNNRESPATATLRREDIELYDARFERALAVDHGKGAAVATLASPNLSPFALPSAGHVLSLQDIERAFDVDDGEEGAVAPTKSKPVKRPPTFDRRHNNQKNKEPSPHIPRETMWRTCWTCNREFGWSAPSQQHYHAHNKKPPQLCDDCATQRHNNKRNLSWNTGK